MERATRILVANSPKLMRDVILAALVDQPGIEIVGEVSDEAEIVRQVQATLPDLLVIALEPTARFIIGLRSTFIVPTSNRQLPESLRQSTTRPKLEEDRHEGSRAEQGENDRTSAPCVWLWLRGPGSV